MTLMRRNSQGFITHPEPRTSSGAHCRDLWCPQDWPITTVYSLTRNITQLMVIWLQFCLQEREECLSGDNIPNASQTVLSLPPPKLQHNPVTAWEGDKVGNKCLWNSSFTPKYGAEQRPNDLCVSWCALFQTLSDVDWKHVDTCKTCVKNGENAVQQTHSDGKISAKGK